MVNKTAPDECGAGMSNGGHGAVRQRTSNLLAGSANLLVSTTYYMGNSYIKIKSFMKGVANQPLYEPSVLLRPF